MHNANLDPIQLKQLAAQEWSELQVQGDANGGVRCHFLTLDEAGSDDPPDQELQEDAWNELIMLGDTVKLDFPSLSEFWAPHPDMWDLRQRSSEKIKLFKSPYSHAPRQDGDLRGHSQLVGSIAAHALAGGIDPLRADADSRFVFAPLQPFVQDPDHSAQWRLRDASRVQQALALGIDYFAHDATSTRSTPGLQTP